MLEGSVKSSVELPRGDELSRETMGVKAIPRAGGAESGAVDAVMPVTDADLAWIVIHWPVLPEGIKSQVRAAIEEAKRTSV